MTGLAPALSAVLLAAPLLAGAPERTKTESFDADPGWEGVNNRSARTLEPVRIRQDFGWSPTRRAGGQPGEIGGFITPAGEAAWYARPIAPRSFRDPLRASGSFACPDGAYNLLLGWFNSRTTQEWRTPSTIAIRLNGRGDHFFAYVEYCTARWRAGGDTTPFPAKRDLATGRFDLIGFPSKGTVHRWTLEYDPQGAGGRGAVQATIGDARAECLLDEGHQADGASFDRFGILNVVKSSDGGGEVYFDDITVDGERHAFDVDPGWEGKGNRQTYSTIFVRPRFDFGFSDTAFAGGKAKGELGGRIFRGDCRHPGSLGAYGDRVGPLTLEKPFRASGMVALRRGVSDSTTLFGFYSSGDSLRRNDSQSDSIPDGVVGVHIEGPSSEGFYFYPVVRPRGGNGRYGAVRESPRILPDGAIHRFTLVYDPEGGGGKGRITVSLDGREAGLDLEDGVRSGPTRLDRFGIVTSWIDGNSQDVFWDDLTYTLEQ